MFPKRHVLSCAMVLLALSVVAWPDWWVAKVSAPIIALLPGGFRVTYYRDDGFSRVLHQRTERHLVNDYRNALWVRRILGLPQSARWEGWLEVPEDGEYTFFLQVTGGARVFVGGDLVVDHWDSPGWNIGKHVVATLPRGCHAIRVDQRLPKKGGAIRLRWTGGPVPPNTIIGTPQVVKRRPVDES